MQNKPQSWDIRFDWTFTLFQWLAFALGVMLSIVNDGVTGSVVAAAAIVGVYASAMQTIPRDIRSTPSVGETMAVIGVVTTVVAIGLTGGVSSPYLLFLGSPVFFGAAFLDMRRGLEIAFLATAGLAVAMFTLDQPLGTTTLYQAGALFLLIAVAMTQARRLNLEEQARYREASTASAEDLQQVERLAAAHNLLSSLSELADAAELNPVTVGEAALRDLSIAVQFVAGEVRMGSGDDAPVVSRRGDPDEAKHMQRIPIRLGNRDVGSVTLYTAEPLTHSESIFVDEALRPVALALDNVILLRDIARRAVREERVRLGRELHDDIGPALASLGLSIDLALHQYPATPDLARHLEGVRQSVTSLVDRIRMSVADLREDAHESVVEQAYAIAREVETDDLKLIIEIDERRPPRRAIAVELAAIMAEAIRNAAEHSSGDTITVSGHVDNDTGNLTVTDNGSGFDPTSVPRGHFGLIGINERAEQIGADLVIDSTIDGGTRVSVHWSPT